MNIAKRIAWATVWLMRGTFATSLIPLALASNWKHFWLMVVALGLSFAPLLIRRNRFSVWFWLTYVGFIFAGFFVGEVLYLYSRWWPYDNLLHFLSGIVLTFGAYYLVQAYLSQKKIPRWFKITIILSIAVTANTLWEIAEFGSDTIFGTNTQDGSLVDTMEDLVLDTLGSVAGVLLIGLRRLR